MGGGQREECVRELFLVLGCSSNREKSFCAAFLTTLFLGQDTSQVEVEENSFIFYLMSVGVQKTLLILVKITL